MSACDCGDDHARDIAKMRADAAWWRRRIPIWYAVLGFHVVAGPMLGSTWSIRLALAGSYACVIVACFCLKQARDNARHAATTAWHIENTIVLHESVDAGLITDPEEGIRMMMSNPPPGVSPKAWRESGEEVLQQWRREHGRDS